jgi:uncharacterized protein YfaS (alpha-2-macroglobulin family)
MLLRFLLLLIVLTTGCVPPAPPAGPHAFPEPPVVVAAPAASPLSVMAVVPEPNSSAVAFDSTVYVQFNHPVVPLTTLDHPVTDAPLQIEPAVAGKGRWINTGLYAFTPAPGWAASTTYQLTAARTEFAWSFSTLPPAVASSTPAPAARLVDPAAPLRVTFNQPADPNTVHFELAPDVPGQLEWTDGRSLVLKPDAPLVPGQDYTARVDIDGTHGPYTWRFQTAPTPKVIRSVPNNGDEAPRLGQVELFFSAPMDRDDVLANLTIAPELDYSAYVSWSDDDTHATIYGAFKPTTAYALSLPDLTHDRFGRPLDNSLDLHFQMPANQASKNAPPVAPQAWLISPGLIGTYNAYEHPHALLRTTNVSRFVYSLDALDESVVLGLVRPPIADRLPDGRRVTGGTLGVNSERNTPFITSIDLGQLASGYYRLRIEPKETNARVQDHLVVVTRTMLAVKEASGQVLVWATDLRTGQPLPDLPVRFFRLGSTEVARGTTDKDGTLQVNVPTSSKEATLVVADRAGDAAMALSTWSGGVGPWNFGLPTSFQNQPTPFTAHAYSDRPIYRPGQTVHLRTIVRADDDAHFSLPGDEALAFNWTVIDSQRRTLAGRGVPRLTEFGTFNVDVDLSTEAATGTYTFNLMRGEQLVTSTSFLVAEYQRSEFEVNLDKSSSAIAGQLLNTSLHAAYYFGQPLAAAAVHWQVSAEPFSFSWPSDPTFRFGDLDQNQRVLAGRVVPRAANAPRAEGKGTTDADGALMVQIPTDLSHDLSSQRFTIEATVTDPDHAEVSNRASVVVHKAGLYVGLKPTSFVAQAGKRQSLELVTLDTEGGPRPNVNLHAQVVRRRWLSVRERDAQGGLRWISRAQDSLAGEFDAHSGADGRGAFDFTPDDGGQYRLIVEAPDAAGNVARTALDVWAAGPGFIPWRITDDARLELQADKPTYRPGETAHVIVPAPVADALALITVERGKLISHSVKRLDGNSAVLDIPIGTEHVPNAYVSVVLFGGGQSPTLLNGYVELPVSSADRQLQLTVEPDRRDHAPGDTVPITIHTRDASGQSVAAEVSVAVVDAAVLALADSRSDPASHPEAVVMAFWHRRPVGVRTGSTLGVSIDRTNDSVSTGLKGGGGGDQASVRQEFPDTAFWEPGVKTDALGEAHLSVRLPDTLTTWRLTAVGVTRDTRLGVANAEVVTNKPLLVRPLAPRFLVGGDVVTVGAAIHNTTSAAQHVTASLRTTSLAIQGQAGRTIDVPAGGQVRLNWPVSSVAGQSGQASLHFDAAAAGVSDAVEVAFPLLAWGVPSTVATAGEAAAADTTSEVVEVPRDIDPQRGELRVEVTPSLAAALRYSLRVVEEYPYECLEQTVSRFLPRLVLDRALNGLGLVDPLNLKAALPGIVSRAIGRVYRFQHPDGGWGWWRDDTSQPYLSAYAVFGLVEARRAGFSVDQGVVDRGTTYLRSWLNSDPGAYGLETRAFVLYVLGEAGAPEPSRASVLFDRRADLGPTGKAYLAQTLAALDASDARVGGLLAELTTAAVVSATGSHWEETNPSTKGWIMASDVRTTAGVLDALVRLRPDHPLMTSTVRWLMAARLSDGDWASTHDVAMSLLALTDYLSASGELQGSFDWQVGLNGQPRMNGKVDDVASRLSSKQLMVGVPELSAGVNHVDLVRSVGSGRLYYTLQLKTFSQAEDMPFLSNGFSLAREYLSPAGGPLGDLHVGDLVQVKVTLLAPADLHDLVIEDPLPAGLEPLDTRLKTTSTAVADAVRSARAPGWQPWTHVDVRSDKLALFATYLNRGAYQYVYLARATLAGEFRVLPTNGHEQYFPDVQARSDGRRFTVLP